MKELQEWYQRLKKTALAHGLIIPRDPQFFLVNQPQLFMISGWSGFEERYAHWSFAKKYEQIRQSAEEGDFVRTEIVIPSRPPRVFLLKSDSLAEILGSMSRSLALIDFTSKNKIWKQRDYSRAWRQVREHARIIKEISHMPGIKRVDVSSVLTAAHAIAYQCKHGIILADRSDDLLLETMARSSNLPEWKRKLLEIVHTEWVWSLPLIATSILFQGWAVFWGLRLLREAGVSGDLFEECFMNHVEFLAIPPLGSLNPSLVGYRILQHIEDSQGKDALFRTREEEHDISLIETYMTLDVAMQCGLFSWGQSEQDRNKLVVKELSDPKGWEKIKGELVRWVGENRFPAFRIEDTNPINLPGLTLRHQFEGRPLDKEQTYGTMKHLHELWGIPIHVLTRVITQIFNQKSIKSVMWSFHYGDKFSESDIFENPNPSNPSNPSGTPDSSFQASSQQSCSQDPYASDVYDRYAQQGCE